MIAQARPDEVHDVLAGDPTAAVVDTTPAGGAVVTSVALVGPSADGEESDRSGALS